MLNCKTCGVITEALVIKLPARMKIGHIILESQIKVCPFCSSPFLNMLNNKERLNRQNSIAKN